MKCTCDNCNDGSASSQGVTIADTITDICGGSVRNGMSSNGSPHVALTAAAHNGRDRSWVTSDARALLSNPLRFASDRAIWHSTSQPLHSRFPAAPA